MTKAALTGCHSPAHVAACALAPDAGAGKRDWRATPRSFCDWRKLTDAGHAFAEKARQLLADYDAAVAQARRLTRGQKEELRIGYLASAAQKLLNPALATLRQVHPQLKIKLHDLSPGEQITALKRGEIDVAFIGQEGSIASRDFYTRKLATMPVLAVLPEDHRLASRKEVRLAALGVERFIGSPGK